jgi:geranylgeranyl diphosphate synthase type II
MQHLEAYRQEIECRIKQIELNNAPFALYEPIRYLLDLGGKRIRPMLSMLSCHLFGSPGLKAIDVGIAVELFHNFTLAHDDIMDKAPLRRGKASLHEKWNERQALLSGDTLFVVAYKQLCKQREEYVPDLIRIFSKTSQEVCEGQQMDMDFEQMQMVNIVAYTEMIRLKTAVLLAAALEMGAIVAGASAKQCKQIYHFGEHIGIAFQLQDDLLDAYPEGNSFGKQLGGDILANKKTFLSISAFEFADDALKNQLLQLQNETKASTKINETLLCFEKLSVKERTENEIHTHFQKSLDSLAAIEVREEDKKTLFALAHMLMQRKH